MTDPLAAIRSHAQAGETALAAGEVDEALALFDRALAELGDGYRRAGVVDDTGMKLTLAEAEARRGNARTAANLKKAVLEARLALAAGK